MTGRAVSAMLRVDDENPGHTRLSVFIGRNEGARGHSGELVLRTDEWKELCTGNTDAVTIRFEITRREGV